MTDACPPFEDLTLFAIGRLSHENMEFVAQHLQVCVSCERQLDEFHQTNQDSTDDLIAALRAPTAGEPFSNEDCLKIVTSISDLVAKRLDGQRRGSDPIAGTKMGGCQLEGLLAHGSFGTVYRATDLASSQVRAIKVLSAFRFGEPNVEARFDREAVLLHSLDHINIVKVFAAGRQDGVPFLVMEMVDGVSLAAVMRRVGKVELAEACQLVGQVALALQHASEKGVIHRDIKPSNLMLTETGEVRVLDFGLAVMTLEVPPAQRLTANGQVLGTPDYIAPEQIQDSKLADLRSDIYSLGCLFYELLSGEPPFRARRSTFAKMRAHRQDRPTPIETVENSVPAEIATLIGNLLEKAPDDRPQSATEVLSVLQPWLATADLSKLAERCRRTT